MTSTRKTRSTLAAIAITLAAGGAAAIAGVTGATADSGAADHTTTLHLLATTTAENLVDNPPAQTAPGPGLSPGDMFVQSQKLTAGAHSVGRSDIVCVATDGPLVKCSVTEKLPGGSIEVGGTIPQSNSFTLAITGGTGAYRNARGTMTVTSVDPDKDTQDRLTLRIIR
jgi:hypothetical protein